MNNRKKILIGLGVSILIIVAITIVWVFEKKELTAENKMNTAAKEYFKETLNTEVYVETLIENGYLESSDKKCTLLKQDGEDIKEEEGDCSRAKEEAKKPVIIFFATDEFKINEWNNKDTTIKASLKNNGNRYYKTDDITNIKWIVESEGGYVEGDTLNIIDEYINETYILYIEFKDKDLVLEKKIDIKLDQIKPVLKFKRFDGTGLMTIYQDQDEIPKTYYAIAEKNETPDKKDMTEIEDRNFECGKKYYAWSYAKDIAGNETEIDFLGEYEKKCTTVTVPSVSSGSNTPAYSTPED